MTSESVAFIGKLSELANPQTFVSEASSNEDDFPYVNKINNVFFSELWNEKNDQILAELVWLCGPCWPNYVFDAFLAEFSKYEVDYYINKYISRSAKTIADFFSKHPEEVFNPAFSNYPKTWKSVFKKLPPTTIEVSTIFFYDFSEFLYSRVSKLVRGKRVDLVDRIRISQVTGRKFKDSAAQKSISFHNRRIPEWELQVYHIQIASNEFDSFRRVGDKRDIENSLPYLRYLLDYIGFIPHKNTSIYDIYRNIPRDKFVGFAKLAQDVFYPIRYSEVYGDWIKAIISSGYLGEDGLLKTQYGYRVVAKDGCVCNSLAERIIDDWLHEKSIEHQKEPRYPTSVLQFAKANFRADWKVGDIYIEYFGLQTEKSYALKTFKKILACRVCNVILIPLFPGDEYTLEKTLLPHLEAMAVRVGCSE